MQVKLERKAGLGDNPSSPDPDVRKSVTNLKICKPLLPTRMAKAGHVVRFDELHY